MATAKKGKQEKEKARIAVVRIRGDANLSPDVRRTFELLRLYRKNYCIVVSSNKNLIRMVQKVKDHATFGEIDESTFAELLAKRGRLAGDKRVTDEYFNSKVKTDLKGFVSEFMQFRKEMKDVPGLKRFFRLSPPRGGFERGGIKKGFAQGGVLGYRGAKINELIRRML